MSQYFRKLSTTVGLYNLLLCIESQTLKTKMFHLTLLLPQTQLGMPEASSLFHDTLLNKINGLIKFHVLFIENKIGNKKEYSPRLINLLLHLF